MGHRESYVLIDERGVYAITMVEPDPAWGFDRKRQKEWDREVARFCAQGIRSGARVERMSRDEACRRLLERLDPAA